MRASYTNLAIIAAFVTAVTTNAYSQSVDPMPESEHWRVRAAVPVGEPTTNQLAPYGYATSGPVARGGDYRQRYQVPERHTARSRSDKPGR
jgi:hypothetical protein